MMLKKLNERLLKVADNLSQFEVNLAPLVKSKQFQCKVDGDETLLSIPNDGSIEPRRLATHYVELFCIPIGDVCGGVGGHQLVSKISGDSEWVHIHLNLSQVRDDDLFAQYICLQLKSYFEKLERRSINLKKGG